MMDFLRCLPEKQGINISPHFSSFFPSSTSNVTKLSQLKANKQQKTDQHTDYFPAKNKARDFFFFSQTLRKGFRY